MPDKPVVLQVRNLSCRHDGRNVLRNVCIDVTRGSLCGLLGPNGSGKTTLFRCLLNLHRAYAGTIHVCGQATHQLSPARMARLVSYVPQNHHAAFPFPVRDIVRMGRNPLLGSSFRFAREHAQAAERALRLLGIEDLAENTFTRLSGGQRQLALIARAVAQEAPLMLLDEPTSALDFQNQIEVWKILRSLAEIGFTVVVCSHDPNHILWFCDQALLLRKGEVIASGRAMDVLTKNMLNSLYGGVCICDELPGGIPVVHPEQQYLQKKLFLRSCMRDGKDDLQNMDGERPVAAVQAGRLARHGESRQ